MSVNTQDMEIVHRVLRRESRLLMELVAAVAPGGTARAKVITDHFRHEGEDELLWSPLLSRVDLEADIVLRMDDEEATLLPLAAKHITEQEWASLGDHLVNNTPKLTLLSWKTRTRPSAPSSSAASRVI